MRVIPFLLLVGCGFGLQATKGDSGADTGTAPASDLPETAVTVEGLLYGIGAGDFVVAEPAGLESFVDDVMAYDLLVYVDAEYPDSLHLAGSLAGSDGYQNPCEVVVALPKAEWTNPVFRSGPADVATTLGGAPATLGDFTLTGTFDTYAFAWDDGTLSATLDAREIDAALPPELAACDLLDDLGSPCRACDDGSTTCFDLRLVDIHAELVTWPFDSTPDQVNCGQ